ncbi:MAG: hypothetical protein A3H98_06750 [Bacteroidetes bacterium RIFCSPLOWO2_02_FULL_36_8]|nr:MAG: hypothetical protein A3H98_06750 [Bacteroidetes bacterium RIFCSPLOWO2_02_FULL_36_8]OFY71162.1 MAG: hypothetical protein A3G23_15260 [Bacteroidetes bacterium RIFCSPLOWO2_12_FULL_37_12]
MNGVNKVILMGRLGQDPKVRYFENGGCIADFSLATTDAYKDKNGNKVEQTEWHNVVLHNQPAQVAEKYLHKGDLVYVEGKLRTKTWDDKEGKKHYMTEVHCLTMNMISTKRATVESNGTKETPVVEAVQVGADTPDHLPF